MSSRNETEASTPACIEDWTQAPWRKLEQHVYRLQKRIYRAEQQGKLHIVHNLQRLLLKSEAARMVAVRRVTQDNHGKKTAGIDGVKSVGPLLRLAFVQRLGDAAPIRARPVRRVWIPKPGKEEQRPLGIPVMLDRAHQALVKLALEPQWEARFEPNSYGFRPGRSCHDAIDAIYFAINKQAKYVLDADIKACFTGIAHPALLAKLSTFPHLRRTIKAWLQAGVMEDGAFAPTEAGVPQGGVISPLLMNIALHGMETVVARSYRRWTKTSALIHPQVIRYADDLVVLCVDEQGVKAAQVALATWLDTLGLRLHPTKTNITHTLHPYEGRVGFDFLGFTIRQYPAGETHSGWNAGRPLGFKTLIQPSKTAIQRHMHELKHLIRKYRGRPQRELIMMLNPRIRGWTNYFRTMVAAKRFNACDHHLFIKLWRWARYRHPNKTPGWIVRRYWGMHPRNAWDFVAREETGTPVHLVRYRDTTIRRHVKVRGMASPFDGNLIYWAQRLQHHPLTGGTVGKLLAQQEGKCQHCGLVFLDGDHLEVDHILPRRLGGNDHLTNKQVLHRHCHDQKTAADLARSVSMTTTS